jgi:putative flippase GtrA
MSPALQRFKKYALVGVSTFALDLVLLFVLTDAMGIPYVLSAALAYGAAVSLNYFISRHTVFVGTVRGLRTGYALFLGAALCGMTLVSAGLFVMVEWLSVHYILARFVVAGFVGVGNYVFNLYINFKVAGYHTKDHHSE